MIIIVAMRYKQNNQTKWACVAACTRAPDWTKGEVKRLEIESV